MYNCLPYIIINRHDKIIKRLTIILTKSYYERIRCNYGDNMDNKEIIDLIVEYVKNYKDLKHTRTSWGDPIIGFADANDELFIKLKEIISPIHTLPSDLVPNAKSVIAFFIPFSTDIVESNIDGEESSEEWDYAYIETNNLIGDLNKFYMKR